MDAGRSRQLRTGVCFALPALALALCAVLGLSATTAAHAADAGQPGHSALVPAPHRPFAAISRMQDPIGFDIVVAEHPIGTAHSSDAAATPATMSAVRGEQVAEHNRGPPDGTHV